jgi:hypothetical protein
VPADAENVSSDWGICEEISLLHATFVRLTGDPVHTESTVSYTLPIVDKVTDPVVTAVSDHQTVFGLGVAQGGVGSVDCMVAAELSTVLTLPIVTAIAFAMLSLIGAASGGFTVKVSAPDCPGFAGSLVTVIEAVVAKATRVWEIVALMEVDIPPDSIVMPAVEPFQRIWAFVAKLLPVAVSVKSDEGAKTNVGLIEVSVGVDPPEVPVGHAFTRFAASIDPSPVPRS